MHACPFCAAPVPDDASHCLNCGGPQTVPTIDKNGSASPASLVGRERTDPWRITHPAAKERFRDDPRALKPLVDTWRLNPDLAGTLAIQREIDDAVRAGDVRREDSYYFCCPWAPIYEVRRKTRIAGDTMRPGQQFTFDVSAEEVYEGGDFKAEILSGDFNQTDEIDYCSPDERD